MTSRLTDDAREWLEADGLGGFASGTVNGVRTRRYHGLLLTATNAAEEARERFVRPLLAHLQEAGLGHVSEIADAEPPFTPGGCPFQAWSLGELIRTLALLEARAASG